MVQGLLGMLFGILEWLISLFPSFQFINKFVLSLIVFQAYCMRHLHLFRLMIYLFALD